MTFYSTCYNITSSSISTSGTTYTISGSAGSAYDYGSSITQSAWNNPTNQFTSIISYNQNLTSVVYVQTGKTVTSSVSEPWFISSSTATISLSFSTYSWASYSSSIATFTGPSTSGKDFVNYTVSLIGTTSTGENIAINFYVKVYSWKLSNCDVCSYDSRSSCTTCKNGYTLSNDKTSWDTSSAVQAIASATQYASSVSIAASACTSMASASSPQSIWSIVNQFQLLMMFQLLGWYISPDVLSYINNFQYASFSFSFIPYYSVPIVGDVRDFFSTTQPNSSLENVELSYGSTIANFFSLFINLFWIFVIHGLFLLIKKWFLSKVKHAIISKILNAIGSIFLWAIYIRMFLEAYLYFLLSLVNEVTSFKTYDASNITSFVFAIPLLIFTIAFAVFVAIHYSKFRKVELSGLSKIFEELYANVKETPVGKFYITMFLLRRTLMVMIVMSVSFTPVLFQGITFSIVQIIWAIFILLRPLDKTKDNIIEGINDTLIALITIVLTIFYQESWWSTTLTNIIVYTLIINGFVINIVIIVDFIIIMIKVRTLNWY